MEFVNVTKGANDGQGIGTTPDGVTVNLPSIKICVAANDIIKIVDETGAVHTVDYTNPSLNKFLTATPQGLINYWFDNNFFKSSTGGGSTSPTNFNVDSDLITTVDNTATLTKSFTQLLIIHKSGVFVPLNRVTLVGSVLTFLDGAVTGEEVEVVGILTP